MVSIVERNKQEYERGEVNMGETARRLQIIMGRPRDRRLKEIIAGRLQNTCP